MTEFATVLHCIDGRVQLPVLKDLQKRFGVPYIDVITEAGMVRHIAAPGENPTKTATFFSLRISMEKHQSRQVALIAHEDCAGNPKSREEQEEELRRGLQEIALHFPEMKRVALWCSLSGEVTPIA
jgi:hypothetical protein